MSTIEAQRDRIVAVNNPQKDVAKHSWLHRNESKLIIVVLFLFFALIAAIAAGSILSQATSEDETRLHAAVSTTVTVSEPTVTTQRISNESSRLRDRSRLFTPPPNITDLSFVTPRMQETKMKTANTSSMTSTAGKTTSPTDNFTQSRVESLSTTVSQTDRTVTSHVLPLVHYNATTSEQSHILPHEPDTFTKLPRSESTQSRVESPSTSVSQSDRTVTSHVLPQVRHNATTSEQRQNPTQKPVSFTKLPSTKSTQTRVSADINRTTVAVGQMQQTQSRDDTGHVTDCHNVSLSAAKSIHKSGGVFDVRVDGLGVIEIYCDLTTDDRRWNVFQRRLDGSVDFYQSWNEYVNGFGDVSKEFWLGLEAVHRMTSVGAYALRIDMVDGEGNRYFAEYSKFEVGPGSQKYRLHVSGYHGNVSDALTNPRKPWNNANGQQFSTKDSDNDSNPEGNCASKWRGGWWYNRCMDANPNGSMDKRTESNQMIWWQRPQWIDLRFTELKFRRTY